MKATSRDGLPESLPCPDASSDTSPEEGTLGLQHPTPPSSPPAAATGSSGSPAKKLPCFWHSPRPGKRTASYASTSHQQHHLLPRSYPWPAAGLLCTAGHGHQVQPDTIAAGESCAEPPNSPAPAKFHHGKSHNLLSSPCTHSWVDMGLSDTEEDVNVSSDFLLGSREQGCVVL